MPKGKETGGASSSGGRWKRQSEDQTSFGATQASSGSLTLPPIDADPFHSVPVVLRKTPDDPTDGEGIVSATFPQIKGNVSAQIKKEAVGPGFGKGPGRSLLSHVYNNCAKSNPSLRNWDEYGLPVPQLSADETPGV